MVSTHIPEIMPDLDLRINEKRWRRRRLFRERDPAPRILVLLSILVIMVLLGVWLEVPFLPRVSLGGLW